MSISLILFFLSLAGVIFMVGRKLTFARSETIIHNGHAHPFVPDVQKIKEVVVNNTKKHGYTITVAIVRFYVLSENLLKSNYQKIKILIKTKLSKNTRADGTTEKQEASKFLKMISDYKQRIRNIKHKIVEEEKNGKI